MPCVTAATALLEFMWENFASFISASFCNSLAEVACVPCPAPGSGVTTLYCYSACVLHPDRHLAWTELPVVAPHLLPPAVAWPALRICSPPSIPSVLAHLEHLSAAENGQAGTQEQAAPLSSPLDGYPEAVEEVYQSIFQYLEACWQHPGGAAPLEMKWGQRREALQLSSQQQERLRRLHIVPVGSRLLRASRLFFRLPGRKRICCLSCSVAPVPLHLVCPTLAVARALPTCGRRCLPSPLPHLSRITCACRELGSFHV